jgi:hypothetical protein
MNNMINNSTIITSSLITKNITYRAVNMTTIYPTAVVYPDNSAVINATPSLDYSTFAQTWNINAVGTQAWNGIAISACGQNQCAIVNGGNIWYSLNYGATWSTSSAPSRAWQSISISSSGKYVSAVANGDYIYYSADSGRTWTSAASIQAWYGIAVSASGQLQSACIAGGGILYSMDYGHTWIASSAPVQPWTCIAMASSAEYQVACVNNGAIWYSIDYGLNWTQSGSPTTFIWTSIAVSASAKFQTAVAAYNGVWTSGDFGATWTQVVTTITPLNIVSVAVSSSAQFQVLAINSATFGSLWYSVDFGATWTSSTILLYAQTVAISSTGQYMTAAANRNTISNSGDLYTATIVLPPIITSKIGVGITDPIYSLQLATDSAGKPGSNTWTIVSDERVKTDIKLADTTRCYNIIKELPLKRYTWLDEVYSVDQVRDRSKLGWIAQDVEKVIPKAVSKNRFAYNKRCEEQEFEYETMIDGEMVTQTLTHPVVMEDVIEDCRDLDTDQIYAVMYGALQKVIADNERLSQQLSTIFARLG